MTRYLLSVHGVAGEVREPMTDAEMQQTYKQVGILDEEMKSAHELPDRLRPVLAVVYLIYNAGLSGPAGSGLCSEAIRLARILVTLLPDEPEVAGLLALLLLTESRRASRTRPDGSLVCSASRTAPDGTGP